MTAVAAMFALGLVALDCPPAGDWPLSGFDEDRCPRVYRIHGSASLDRGLDVVILSDAFAADELDDFRCAAGLITEKLVSTPPFDEYSDSINVYRIDLASSSSGVEYPATCGGKTCSHPPPSWPDKAGQCARFAARRALAGGATGDPVPGADRPECIAMDLDVRACPPTAEECQVLWPEGEGLRRLWRVAACAPAFDVVVVLANSGAWAGGGVNDNHPPLSVATLNGIGTWENRSRLLIHEFAHSLGLLDEYPVSRAYTGRDKELPVFHRRRNLVAAVDGAPPAEIPWADLCTPGTEGTVVDGDCRLVCGECGGCDPVDPLKAPAVGVYAGGFYSDCDYYRAAGVCTMQAPEDPMCPVCTDYVRGLFRDLGMELNAGGPHSTEDPDAGPATPAR